jgi:hypothetical protein
VVVANLGFLEEDEVPSEAYKLIRLAVLNRSIVAGWYAGHYREMCPHVLGLTEGREKAFFYQFGGTSSKNLDASGSEGNWRCLFIEQLSLVKIYSGRWHSSLRGCSDQKCVEVVDVCVD